MLNLPSQVKTSSGHTGTITGIRVTIDTGHTYTYKPSQLSAIVPPPPVVPPAPAPVPTPVPVAFHVGVNAGQSDLDVARSVQLGARLARVSFNITDSAQSMDAVIAKYRKAGIKVLALAEFYATLPTVQQAASLAAWATRHGDVLAAIEFGNEASMGYQYEDGYTDQSYKDRARNYALRARDAGVALAGLVPLLLQAEDGGSGSSTWVDQMYAAVPNLHTFTDGWTVHPYGPGGLGKVTRMQAWLKAKGAPDLPVWATEVGLTSMSTGTVLDKYWDTAYTYTTAAAKLSSILGDLKTAGVDVAIVYQIADQSSAAKDDERYFGVFAHDGTAKGAYTTTVMGAMTA